MASGSSQRAYSAACPGCGAPVEFRSAQSTHAVCGFCKSTVVRTGDVLSRIGKMAELFDDFSPLQLQASGVFQAKKFTLVGRLQYKYGDGTWTEWYAAFDDPGDNAQQGVGYLSEDNGAFVFTLPAALQRTVPAADQLRVGATTAIDGKSFSVASVQTVALLSAQGELPRLPALGEQFAMVELRSADGEVFSIDYGAVAGGGEGNGGMPSLSRGKSVLLDDLKMTGLKGASGKEDKGQQFACPNCGAQVAVALASSKTITCRSCNSIIDLSQGVGAQLKHAIQSEPVELLIPLGATGQLQGVSWQVVGFQHRMGNEPGDDEHFGWSEYLLYNQKRGFIFLVDAEDGWSVVKPLTGAADYKSGAQSATYLGTKYDLQSTYAAEANYVAGEFYWQVERGEKTSNIDFAKGRDLLSREQSANEVTWSSGSKVEGRTVAAAFKLDENAALFKRVDAQPLSSSAGAGIGTIVVVVIALIILSALMTRCERCDPNTQNCSSSSSRTSGGAYGGGFSGGGHK